MKAEPSWLIPKKLAANVELLNILYYGVNRTIAMLFCHVHCSYVTTTFVIESLSIANACIKQAKRDHAKVWFNWICFEQFLKRAVC